MSAAVAADAVAKASAITSPGLRMIFSMTASPSDLHILPISLRFHRKLSSWRAGALRRGANAADGAVFVNLRLPELCIMGLAAPQHKIYSLPEFPLMFRFVDSP